MSKIKRYHMETEGDPVYPMVEDYGEWIKYEDHVALIERLKGLCEVDDGILLDKALGIPKDRHPTTWILEKFEKQTAVVDAAEILAKKIKANISSSKFIIEAHVENALISLQAKLDLM